MKACFTLFVSLPALRGMPVEAALPHHSRPSHSIGDRDNPSGFLRPISHILTDHVRATHHGWSCSNPLWGCHHRPY
jgi:hypothetical protein